MARKYNQGTFVPRNPEKYVGDVNNIIYRSSWEQQFLRYCDLNPAVKQYSSEELAIPYYNELDSKMHRYFPDMIMTVENKKGELVKMVVEIKPYMSTILPSSKNKKTLMEQTITYVTNQAKWKAAEEWCSKNGFKFVILTERDLFKNGNR